MKTEQALTGGYIVLARRMFEPDSLMMDKPPMYFKLWVWMLAKANWRDRDKLKRGQLFTTIDEMQEAMRYYVGYRKVTPSKGEIRSAYEAFKKAAMITTAKSTRGTIVTICNYNLYQDKKNYEAHNEAHDEAPMKHTVTAHDTE